MPGRYGTPEEPAGIDVKPMLPACPIVFTNWQESHPQVILRLSSAGKDRDAGKIKAWRTTRPAEGFSMKFRLIELIDGQGKLVWRGPAEMDGLKEALAKL